jgi:hypothetical protein
VVVWEKFFPHASPLHQCTKPPATYTQCHAEIATRTKKWKNLVVMVGDGKICKVILGFSRGGLPDHDPSYILRLLCEVQNRGFHAFPPSRRRPRKFLAFLRYHRNSVLLFTCSSLYFGSKNGWRRAVHLCIGRGWMHRFGT